ncbi:MAG: hypothetical protein C4524_10285 [Candidatus Zixiibacteriota bacterium]|nr:MAG: hypothetical protein C4524_10285 [candidate division Zixibacteria bacterium]
MIAVLMGAFALLTVATLLAMSGDLRLKAADDFRGLTTLMVMLLVAPGIIIPMASQWDETKEKRLRLLAALPVTRRQISASRLIYPAVVTALNVVILLPLAAARLNGQPIPPLFWPALGGILIMLHEISLIFHEIRFLYGWWKISAFILYLVLLLAVNYFILNYDQAWKLLTSWSGILVLYGFLGLACALAHRMFLRRPQYHTEPPVRFGPSLWSEYLRRNPAVET